jgi:hypothetical protein
MLELVGIGIAISATVAEAIVLASLAPRKIEPGKIGNMNARVAGAGGPPRP